MVKIGFGSNIKPKGFGFKPQFYDAEKEKFQERFKSYTADSSDTNGNIELLKSRIRGGIKHRAGIESKQNSSPYAYTIRMILILVCLFLFAYLILSSNKILSLMELLSN